MKARSCPAAPPPQFAERSNAGRRRFSLMPSHHPAGSRNIPPSLIYKTFDGSFRHALLIRRYGPIAIPLPPPSSESESVGVLALVNGGVKTTMVGPQVI